MKICFVCPKCDLIDISKVPSKDGIDREKSCSRCKTPMNFIRHNKKKYKNLAKQLDN